MRVRCYWNLHQRVWSVVDVKTGRVVGHASKVIIRDASFVVREAGRQRVLAEGKKNVHAFVVGELSAASWEAKARGSIAIMVDWCRGDDEYVRASTRLGSPVFYNPRRDTQFMIALPEGIEPCREAEMVILGRKGAGKPIPHVAAFDPCQMNEAESARATV